MAPLLEIDDLHAEITLRRGTVRALDGVSLDVAEGECLGIVGESGSGKTVTALSVIRLLPPGGRITRGRITLAGQEITGLDDRAMRRLRGSQVGMIFQDPMTSLDPTMPVGEQIAETVRLHRGASARAARERAVEVLGLVGLPRPVERVDSYPHQLSGGMRQRVLIAMALACEPRLLIADEPTTALDVTIQRQILELIDDLRRRLAMAVVLVTHDMGVIAGHTDRAAVLYAGRVLEIASTAELFASPRHPYTEALLRALPERAQLAPGGGGQGSGPPEPPAGHAARRLHAIPGAPPDLAQPQAGCRFAPRCSYARDVCRQSEPPLDAAGPGGRAHRCFFPLGAPGGTRLPDGTVATSAEVTATAAGDLLRVTGLVKSYPATAGALLRRRIGDVSAVADVSFSIRRGQTFGLVGESGCGKTTVGRLVAGLERASSGSVLLDGEDIVRLAARRSPMSQRERRRRSPRVQLMFQDAYASLDPRMRVGAIVREPLAIQRAGSRSWQRQKVAQMLDEVGLPQTAAGRYAREFSGGQRQRVGLARALILQPDLVIADEPVSALDVSVQAQILNLILDLQRDLGLTMLFISHDLSVVRYMSDTIGVMYLGKLVETGPAGDVYDRPVHPYTRGLVDAVPVADPAAARASAAVRGVLGELPSAIRPPSGCRFRTRCPLARDICAEVEPEPRPFGAEGHVAACHFPLRQPA